MIDDGFYRNYPEKKYHAAEGISKTDMKGILRSPAHWRSPDPPDTEAMEFGSAMHPGILEPERFKREFIVYPASVLPGSGEGQRSRKKDFDDQAEAKGQTVIDPKYMDQITAMKDAVMRHRKVKELKLLEDGESELSAWWFDPEFEVLTKCRFDYLNTNLHRITDLKSTTDARKRPFGNIAEDKMYGLQAGHYLYTATRFTKVPHNEFYFIAIERPKIKGQFVGVMVYQATEYLINEGLRQRSEALIIYKDCEDKGEWPGYTDELEPLDAPVWKKRKDMILG